MPEFLRALYQDLAPNGTMRAGINFGNVTIAHRDGLTGEPHGFGVDLIDDLARRLAVPRMLLTYEGAGPTFEAGLAGDWDLAFLAIDPVRAQQLDFTIPYLVLEGSFLVRADSPTHTVIELDLEGIDIAVAEGSFHDLHLTRRLRHARLVRFRSFACAVTEFLGDGLDAVAGLGLPLAATAATHAGLRVIEGRYAAVQQAIAVPKGRGASAKYLNAYLEGVIASGQVAAAKASWETETDWMLGS